MYCCLEPPKSPVNLESVMISSRSVNIQWQQQLADSTEVTKYLVQYQENHGECSQPLSSIYMVWQHPQVGATVDT